MTLLPKQNSKRIEWEGRRVHRHRVFSLNPPHFGVLGCKCEYGKVLALKVFIIKLKKKSNLVEKETKGMNRQLKGTEIVLLLYTEKEVQPHQQSRKCNLKEQDTMSSFTVKTMKKVDNIYGRQNNAPLQKIFIFRSLEPVFMSCYVARGH